MNAYDVMCMLTINGVKMLESEDKIGSIDIKKLVDIIIIDLEDIKLKPLNNIFSEIVYNVKSNNVDTTSLMVNKCKEIIKKIYQIKNYCN